MAILRRSAGALIITLCLIHNLSASSNSGTVSGSVLGVGGTRLPGAVITLKHQGTGQVFTVNAGARGLYRVTNLPPGSYELTAELSGFKTGVVSDVTLTDDAPRVVDFLLDVALTINEFVTVIGEAPRDSMEAVAFRESPARDVGEALTETAGVWKSRKGGIASDVVVRGFQRGDLNVLIDGQRLYGACPNRMDPASFHVDFSEVERVDVAKGPFDMKNQGGLGGSVNIVTRKPEEGWHLDGNLSVGSFSFINPSATVSYGARTFSALGGYSYRTSDPYKDGSGRLVTELGNYKPGSVDGKAFEIGTAWGRIGWTPAPDHQLQLSYSRQDVDHTYYPYLFMDAVYDDTDRLNLRYEALGLSPSITSLNAQGYFNQVKHWMTDQYRTSSNNAPRSYSMGTLAKTQTYGGKLEMEIRTITVGLEAFERFWSAATELAGIGYKPQYSIPDVNIRTLGFYLEYTSTLSKHFSLSTGGRLDHAKSFADNGKANTDLYFAYNDTRSTAAADTFPSGKLRLTYTSASGMELSSGFGHTVRFPEHSERFFALKRKSADWVGNPELSPSRASGLDVAFAVERAGFRVGADVYVNWIDDFITVHDQQRINTVPGVMNTQARSYANVDATFRGGEIDVVWSLTDQLFLSGDLSYVRGTKQTSSEGGIFSKNVAEIPPLRSRIKLRYEGGRWFGSVEGIFSARQGNVDTDLREEETPGYATANVRVGTSVNRLSITAGMDNMFDKLYIEHLSYLRDPFRSGVRVPEPGRNFFVNVRYRF